MRRTRFKAEASVQVAHYHCVSRVVDRNFVLGELEKETFVKLMRRYETYCGVRVLSFCIMTNHFRAAKSACPLRLPRGWPVTLYRSPIARSNHLCQRCRIRSQAWSGLWQTRSNPRDGCLFEQIGAVVIQTYSLLHSANSQ
jgi:hypothetical protein